MRIAVIVSCLMVLASLAGCAGHGGATTRPDDAVSAADRVAIEAALTTYAQAYAAGDADAVGAQFFTTNAAQAEFVRAWSELAAAGARLWPVAVEEFGEDDAATLFGVAEATPPPLARQFLGETSFLGMSWSGPDRVMVGGGIGECCPFTIMKRLGRQWKIDLVAMIGGEPLPGEAAAMRGVAAKMQRVAEELTGGRARSQVEYLRELSAPKK